MQHTLITEETLLFLRALEENNNREWFNDNKDRFKGLETGVKLFFSGILEGLKEHDNMEAMKVFRIYRDVRFSHDKSPYKGHFAASFSRLGAHNRGGYYIRIKPGASFVAVGFWQPNKEDLLRLRKEFQLDASEFRDVVTEPSLVKIWGPLQGDELKTAPKGFDKEDPNIDLIRKKQFLFVRNFTDQEVLSPTFREQVDHGFKAIRPYFDLMGSILTTDLNGVSLLDQGLHIK
ncbi:MAG: DUF2461 domain-containing protein [Sediminicola sp.]